MEALIIIAFYVFIAAVVITLGFFLYLRSVASRKRHACPQCGEKQTVELMHASRCNTCGAPFDAPRS